MRYIAAALAATFVVFALSDALAGPRTRGAKAPAEPFPPARLAPHADDGYFSDYLSGPGGQRTRLRDYPGSATVITRKMMNDFQANDLCDALRLAPGVIASGC